MSSGGSSIERVVSGFRALSSKEHDRYSIDGLVPQAVIVTENEDEVSEVLKKSNGEGLSVTPWGGGTMMSLGGIPQRIDIVLLLKKIDKVIEYAPEDLVVSVGAGTRLHDLQSVLACKRQFLPLDPPYASSATLGGITMANSFGSRRHLYGGVKDLLLGIRMVHADGSVTKAGGTVMKNVAGYDLRKLYVGSLGTLGVAVQTTYKVYPLPAFQATFISSFRSFNNFIQAAHEILMNSHSSIGIGVFAVDGLDLASNRIISDGAGITLPEGYLLAAGVQSMGTRSMERRLSELKIVAGKHESLGTYNFEGTPHNVFWNTVQEFPALTSIRANFPVRCKVTAMISKVGELIRDIQALTEMRGIHSAIVAHMGLGIFHFYLDARRPDETTKVIEEARRYLPGSGSSLVIEAAPVEVKQKVDTWGSVCEDLRIMKGIKKRFDPNRVLNPGRYVGGI